MQFHQKAHFQHVHRQHFYSQQSDRSAEPGSAAEGRIFGDVSCDPAGKMQIDGSLMTSISHSLLMNSIISVQGVCTLMTANWLSVLTHAGRISATAFAACALCYCWVFPNNAAVFWGLPGLCSSRTRVGASITRVRDRYDDTQS